MCLKLLKLPNNNVVIIPFSPEHCILLVFMLAFSLYKVFIFNLYIKTLLLFVLILVLIFYSLYFIQHFY